jgi:hypothetical protein
MKPPLPSPWSGQFFNFSTYIMSGDRPVARVQTHSSHNNLPLLLAAPELLNALEIIVSAANVGDPDSLANAINDAVPVIAKARGEKHA